MCKKVKYSCFIILVLLSCYTSVSATSDPFPRRQSTPRCECRFPVFKVYDSSTNSAIDNNQSIKEIIENSFFTTLFLVTNEHFSIANLRHKNSSIFFDIESSGEVSNIIVKGELLQNYEEAIKNILLNTHIHNSFNRTITVKFLVEPTNNSPVESIENILCRENSSTRSPYLLVLLGPHTIQEESDTNTATIITPEYIAVTNSEDNKRTIKEIQTVIANKINGLEILYKKILKEKNELQGKLTIKMIIAPSGTVVRATVLESSLYYPEFEKVIVNKVKRWKFGRVSKGTTTVIQTFIFSTK